MNGSQIVFVGIKGSVVAVDRGTGTVVWKTPLTGSDFVNVVGGGEDLFATTKGELFCIDAATGHVRWHNRLKGLGLGLATVVVPGGTSDQVTIGRRRREQQEAAAAAAAGS